MIARPSAKNCPSDNLPAVLVPSIVSDPLIPSGPPQLNCSECSLVDSKLRVVTDCPSSVTGLESSGTLAILSPDSDSGSNGSATGFKVEAPAPLDQISEMVESFVDGCNPAYSGMGAGPLYADSSGAIGISHADAVAPEAVESVPGVYCGNLEEITSPESTLQIPVPQPAVNASDEEVDSEKQPGPGLAIVTDSVGHALEVCWRQTGLLLCQGQCSFLVSTVAAVKWPLSINRDGLELASVPHVLGLPAHCCAPCVCALVPVLDGQF
ncbi:hypothetical protein Nepgr_022999 [Nepenthes gracilis]|uniref:Uncharacterized protein n=1 Tax=Nepenthes gracilis TaxID=150966 RepID=A0AAD3T1V5_NEPGR|nr:hypothetical protein Nepgr_022999 [Nepenthes gracilis]